MRWILISDIHANLEALEAVLEHAGGSPEAPLVCCGDVVGYGPDPDACIDLLRARGAVCIAGNHEGMVLGELGFNRCIHAGITAALWTRQVLTEPHRRWLAALPKLAEPGPELLICHGSLSDPEEYLCDGCGTERAFEQLATRHRGKNILVCGHTHQQAFYTRSSGWSQPPWHEPVPVPQHELCLINPGAVGQSRDSRPLARYARLDLDAQQVEFFELPYDHHKTLRKLRSAGLEPLLTLPRRGPVARKVEGLRTHWARWRAARVSAPPPASRS